MGFICFLIMPSTAVAGPTEFESFDPMDIHTVWQTDIIFQAEENKTVRKVALDLNFICFLLCVVTCLQTVRDMKVRRF
jgi:hypothetical protein